MTKPVPPRQWLSAEHRADTPEFRRFVQREFPAVTDLCTGPDRRHFLRLMAASLSMAGLAGCDDPPDGRAQEVPYVRNPLRIQPGASVDYATMSVQDGLANGIVVTTRNARPLKVEGNPDHPWSRGGTDVWAQASVLDLYDPLRSQTVRYLNKASSWQSFRSQLVGKWADLHQRGGEGLHILTGPLGSPSFLAQFKSVLAMMPKAVWYTHSPTGGEHRYAGTVAAYGRPLETRYRFESARIIVSLDGDFLDGGPDQIAHAHDWVAARRASAAGKLLALHAAASVPSLTSAKADHPLVASPAELLALAAGLLADIQPGATPAADSSPIGQWRAAAAAALLRHRGAGLVVAGSTASPALAAAVHRLNAALGNTGTTAFHTNPVLATGKPIAALAEAIRAGSVDTLMMLDTNPVYDAPGILGFADALQRVKLRIHAGQYVDETALHSDWHLPLQQTLESWSDARAADGTITLAQPTIDPLYEGRTVGEILSLLVDEEPRDARDLVRSYYQGSADDAAFAPKWEAMLRDGFVPNTALPTVTATLAASPPASDVPGGLAVVIRPDPALWAGASANNAWLQELPKPLTRLVWDNVLTVSPAFAAREGYNTGDVAVLAFGGRQVEGPIWVLPGQADHTVGATLGYGRQVPGLLCDGIGYNAATLRGSNEDGGDPWVLTGAVLGKTGRTVVLATTQDHDTMEGHDFIRVQHEGAAPVGESVSWNQPSLYSEPRPPENAQSGPQWGMVIDLDACIGCSACVVACQSENNIAVVGKEQVVLGREMHWLRVDRYYEGPAESPQTRFQPVPCMHCENAPCEVGCPVEATLHDSEGLNLMVYNRCVGTRACSGYCPYKVRHFNYLDYSAGTAPTIALMRNPEVTVRARGVMEKCTYCVQRIENARIDAHKANAPIPDGAVQTACQGACPTRAISFGNIADKASAVSAARADDRNYALLGELNTKPRTSYLAARAAKPEAGTTPGDAG